MGIITLMSVPNLVKSIRANRLRTAARTVVAAGKYARSMAVMRQRELRLVFHIDTGLIEVTDSAGGTVGPATELLLAEDRGETEKKSQPQPGSRTLSRVLKNAKIDSVDIENEGMTSEGSCSVAYRRNGRCTPYSVVLIDKRGTRRTITVDSLSTARAEER
jgi:Tfp pilus assembly protein FimT